MTLIDIGANLAHDSFDHDLDAVLDRAAAAGIEAIVVTGSSAESSRKALELARNLSSPRLRLYSTAGLHPHHASEWNAEHAALFRDLAGQAEVVAMGECGLDYFRDLSPRGEQRRAFTAQLELAVELGKPVFLHQRDAHADFLAILKEFRPRLTGVVVHCFTGTQEALEDYLSLDCYIGITGWICDERRNQTLLSAAGNIPQNRLLLETDAPYLLPRTVRPKPGTNRNEPCFLPWVARAVAQARGESLEQLSQCTTDNARRFLKTFV